MSCYSYKKIGFIGAGCYGTAIAQSMSVRAEKIMLITDSQTINDDINSRHVSSVLGNAKLSENISCAINDYFAIKDCEVLFITVPVGAVVTVCNLIKENAIKSPVILCSKGVDTENARLISEVV